MNVLIVGRNLTAATIGKELTDAGYLVDVVHKDFEGIRSLSYEAAPTNNLSIVIFPYHEQFFGIRDNGAISHTFNNRKNPSSYMNEDAAILSEENFWYHDDNTTIVVADYWKAEIDIQRKVIEYNRFIDGEIANLDIFDDYCVALIKNRPNCTYQKRIYDKVLWAEYPDELLFSYGYRDIFYNGTPNYGGCLWLYGKEKLDKNDHGETTFLDAEYVKRVSVFPNPDGLPLYYCETLHSGVLPAEIEMEEAAKTVRGFANQKLETLHYHTMRGQVYRGVNREYIKIFDNRKSFALVGPYGRDFEACAFSEVAIGREVAQKIIDENGRYD